MTAANSKLVSAPSDGDISIRGIEKNFGQTKVLKGVDLEILDGEFVVLLGPSGCGKTTLLRIVAGLEAAISGEVWIGGRMVNALEPKERNVAMVFQNYALYPHMTVFNNQSFSLRLKHMPQDQIRSRVMEAAHILGLENLLARYPRELSGGQRQRVAMGRAMVRSPKVFLFDEPLSNLDAQLRVHMRGEIKDLHHRLATTSIYVTHDQVEAMTMGDRIVIMNQGVVEQIGSPLDVFDRPRNLFVAGFVGSPAMNFIDGEVIKQKNSASVAVADGFSIPVMAAAAGYSGRKVVLGIRPHHIHLDPTSALTFEVKDIQPTGIETILLCHLGGKELLVQTNDRVMSAPGQRLRFSMKSSDIHLFDAASGERLPL